MTPRAEYSVAGLEIPGTILADADGAVCKKLGVGDFTVFRVDPDGVIDYRGGIDGLARL